MVVISVLLGLIALVLLFVLAQRRCKSRKKPGGVEDLQLRQFELSFSTIPDIGGSTHSVTRPEPVAKPNFWVRRSQYTIWHVSVLTCGNSSLEAFSK